MSARRNELFLWAIAIIAASLGTWLMFDSMPGIGWSIWTTAGAAGLLLFSRRPVSVVAATAALAAVIAWGAAVTADPVMHGLICLTVVLFLAMSMLLSTDARVERVTPAFTAAAPVVAFASAILESIGRATHALHVVRSNRARSVVRGVAITIPVLIVFALLLASADPIFATWRDSIGRILETWHFLPRTIFFFALLTATLGAYGFASAGSLKTHELKERPPHSRWLGDTERLILLGSVAVLFWGFLLVQLSYLFGNVPSTVGSGMTFAEYARRGFAELTIVASASVILVLFCDHFGEETGRKKLLNALTLALIVAVLFLLGSAFNRVLLYEAAYGFTTARLYAQTYMLVVGVALIGLAVELRGEVSTARLFRITGLAASIAFIALLYWNHEAWIASRNVDRVGTTGKLDVAYLTRELSPNAVPVLVERLPGIPEPHRTALREQILRRYSRNNRIAEDQWYEYSARRNAAREALVKLGVSLSAAPKR